MQKQYQNAKMFGKNNASNDVTAWKSHATSLNYCNLKICRHDVRKQILIYNSISKSMQEGYIGR